jgi:glycosyltransferase involved in cell wall biosynthesis
MLEQPFAHEENVLLCPPNSPEAMANAIITVIDNPELREHLRVGSLNFSQEWFSWESAIDRTLAAFSTASYR